MNKKVRLLYLHRILSLKLTGTNTTTKHYSRSSFSSDFSSSSKSPPCEDAQSLRWPGCFRTCLPTNTRTTRPLRPNSVACWHSGFAVSRDLEEAGEEGAGGVRVCVCVLQSWARSLGACEVVFWGWWVGEAPRGRPPKKASCSRRAWSERRRLWSGAAGRVRAWLRRRSSWPPYWRPIRSRSTRRRT